MEEEPGEEAHLRQERGDAQTTVDTTPIRNSSQVSETWPLEFVNTAENCVEGKVEFTLHAGKELTSDKWIMYTSCRVSECRVSQI